MQGPGTLKIQQSLNGNSMPVGRHIHEQLGEMREHCSQTDGAATTQPSVPVSSLLPAPRAGHYRYLPVWEDAQLHCLRNRPSSAFVILAPTPAVYLHDLCSGGW